MNVSQWSDLPLVLTSDQAAAVLQLKRRTVANMLDRGVLRGVKVGKEWRVSRNEIMRLVEGDDPRPSGAVVRMQPEAAPVLVRKGGLLVVRTEPLADVTNIVEEEREQRVSELIRQAGL